MVRVAGENRSGAIELLEQHDADELMRPGRRAKGQDVPGAPAQALRNAVGPADHKTQGGAVLLPAFFEQCGQSWAVDILAGGIENNNHGAIGEDVGDCNRFFRTASLRLARAALADFNALDLAQPERAAERFGAFAIGRAEFPLGSLFQPAYP